MGRRYTHGSEHVKALEKEVNAFIKDEIGVDVSYRGWCLCAEKKGPEVKAALTRYIVALRRLDVALDRIVDVHMGRLVASEQTGGPLTIEQEAWLRGALVPSAGRATNGPGRRRRTTGKAAIAVEKGSA
jgi:hypothetical protein